jgi:4-diphosphocytidyl-2-C-methyl-D-erythritol kinase
VTPDTATGAHIHVVRFAPAKLNLTLAVVGRREDGYHSLHSVMVPLALGDALTVSKPPSGAAMDSLRITGLPLPTEPNNLVLRAIAAARAEVEDGVSGTPAPPLAVRLAKRIPVAAGLGGGSSDAAAAIEAALAAWGAVLAPERKAALAAALGSDVPFFLAGGAALVTGRGEFVEPLPDFQGEQPAVLLVTPRLPLATADVFKAYARAAAASDAARARDISERLAADMRAGLTAATLLERLLGLASANSLRPAAESIVPGMSDFVAELESVVDRPVCQSGSGPTLWSLYPTLAEARKAVRFVRLAVANGTLPLLGTGEPFVAATTIAGRPLPPPVLLPGRTTGTIRPRTVHNGSGANGHGHDEPAAEPVESKGDQTR